jgi:hypothetical protein
MSIKAQAPCKPLKACHMTWNSIIMREYARIAQLGPASWRSLCTGDFPVPKQRPAAGSQPPQASTSSPPQAQSLADFDLSVCYSEITKFNFVHHDDACRIGLFALPCLDAHKDHPLQSRIWPGEAPPWE